MLSTSLDGLKGEKIMMECRREDGQFCPGYNQYGYLSLSIHFISLEIFIFTYILL